MVEMGIHTLLTAAKILVITEAILITADEGRWQMVTALYL